MFHSEQLCVANHRGNGWGVLIELENQPDANCERLWSIKSSSMRGFTTFEMIQRKWRARKTT
jgi:hypothetical protein